MLVTIVGAAAGGGFPQWNCGCAGCREVRSGSSRALARTQDSVAVREGEQVHLLNASPDILQQIRENDFLHPRGPRHSPIASIVLTNGDLDHVLGLFSLRESYPLVIYATERVRQGLVENNVLFRTLQRFEGQVTWRRLVLGEAMPLSGLTGTSKLQITAIASPGKRPVHLMGSLEDSPEDNIGVLIGTSQNETELAYLSSAAADGPHLDQVTNAKAVLFDGTFWTSDELIHQGLSKARAEDMAHWPVSGEGGSLKALTPRIKGRRIYTHINNTNPMLLQGTEERRIVEASGWEIAFDGMTFEP